MTATPSQANGQSAAWTNGGDTNQWTWQGGSNTVPCIDDAVASPARPNITTGGHCVAHATYGTQGTAAAANTPGGRTSAIRWTDSNGNRWLFGGLGGDPNSGVTIWFDDLWEYSATTNEWTWMGGINSTTSSTVNGVYGTLGTAASTNLPGSRHGGAAWVDSNGNLWLFGGDGYDSSSSDEEYLNDLWMYSTTTNQWTWMGGSKTVACTTTNDTTQCMSPGVYGALGTPGATNIPGGRKNAATWTDASGNLWLFGGQGGDPSTGTSIWFNDLWKYSPSTNEWTWMGGSSALSTGGYQNGVYGTQGTAASSNLPGSRQGASSWTDASGNLWLFGGQGYDSSNANPGYLNDLWAYTPSTGAWSWIDGSNAFTCSTASGTTSCGAAGSTENGDVYSPVDYPEGRQNAAAWKDNSGNFWIFGGQGGDPNTGFGLWLDDLWAYSPTTGRWMLEGGKSPVSSVTYNNGVYGTQGTAASTNLPGSRQQAAAWKDSNGKLWLFGGDGYDSSSSNDQYLNDLWTVSPSAGNASVTLAASSTTPAYGDTLTLTTSASTPCTGLCSFWIFDGTTVLTPGALPNSTSSNGTTRTFTFTTSTLSAGAHFLSVEYVDTVAHTLVNSYPIRVDVKTPAATPSFSPAGGTYTSAQSVTLSDTTTGAAIYYTTDGSTPTVDSTLYSTPISVNSAETIKAIAIKDGLAASNIASAAYTIVSPAATPSFSPAGGTYTSAQTVTLSSTTAGAAIHYTTDGSTPTANSALYSAPISVSATETIKAIAIASGYDDSPVASATYTINVSNPPPAVGGLSPAYTSQGSSAFTLTVNGARFLSTSVVYWGNTALSTQYVSSTRLTAQVPASDVATAGITSITVQTPAPGGGTSNAMQFEVDSASPTVTAPSFPSPSSTVQAGGTATYAVGLPTTLTPIGITCLNLPTGASCSYSASTGAVSITTVATTPAGNYTITIVFNGTQSPIRVTGFIFLPWLLLPLYFARKKLAAHRAWMTVLGLLVLAGILGTVGCGGGYAPSNATGTQVTSSGTVTLTVQ